MGKFLKINFYIAKKNNFSKKNEALKNLRKIYSFLGVSRPEEAERKWIELLRKLNLESDFKKIGIDNRRTINYLVKNVNMERLSNHPVKMNKADLIKIFVD